MSLLTLSGPSELSSSFPGRFTSPQTLSDERREVASFSLRITCGVRRHTSLKMKKRVRSYVTGVSKDDSSSKTATDEKTSDLGVRAALSMLKFYRSEISPLLPSSCRYVPSCSVYSMEAYKKYGFVKGTILTAWRLCRCNPLVLNGRNYSVRSPDIRRRIRMRHIIRVHSCTQLGDVTRPDSPLDVRTE